MNTYVHGLSGSKLLTHAEEVGCAVSIEDAFGKIANIAARNTAIRDVIVAKFRLVESGELQLKDVMRRNPDDLSNVKDSVKKSIELIDIITSGGNEELYLECGKAIAGTDISRDLWTDIVTEAELTNDSEDFNSVKNELKSVFKEIDTVRNHVVSANLRLVRAVAGKFNYRGVTIEDLVQEGNIGLMKAVEKFDHRRNLRFSTYATWWIRQAISRYLAEHMRLIRLPVHMSETINTINRAITDYTNKHGVAPSMPDLSKITGISESKIDVALSANYSTMSLEDSYQSDESGYAGHVSDTIADETNNAPDEAISELELNQTLNDVLAKLSPKQESVLRLRFGLGDNTPKTLSDIGQIFKVTRERIRQIEAVSLNKIKTGTRHRRLKEFLD